MCVCANVNLALSMLEQFHIINQILIFHPPAALAAHLQNNATCKLTRQLVLQEVTPHSLGFGQTKLMERMISKNSPIPIEVQKQFTTRVVPNAKISVSNDMCLMFKIHL